LELRIEVADEVLAFVSPQENGRGRIIGTPAEDGTPPDVFPHELGDAAGLMVLLHGQVFRTPDSIIDDAR
jgi:hypothetical protein